MFVKGDKQKEDDCYLRVSGYLDTVEAEFWNILGVNSSFFSSVPTGQFGLCVWNQGCSVPGPHNHEWRWPEVSHLQHGQRRFWQWAGHLLRCRDLLWPWTFAPGGHCLQVRGDGVVSWLQEGRERAKSPLLHNWHDGEVIITLHLIKCWVIWMAEGINC